MDESLDTSRDTPGEFEWGGSAGLLAELSRLLEGGRCDWMEEALCPTPGRNRDDLARTTRDEEMREAAANEPRRPYMAGTATVPIMRKQRHGRRYEGGLRCLYCMRFDSRGANSGDGRCEHVMGAVEEWEQQESPSILPGSLLQILLDGHTRKDMSSAYPAGARKFASFMRWRKLLEKHRRGKGDRRVEKDEDVDKVQTSQIQSSGDVESDVHTCTNVAVGLFPVVETVPCG